MKVISYLITELFNLGFREGLAGEQVGDLFVKSVELGQALRIGFWGLLHLGII